MPEKNVMPNHIVPGATARRSPTRLVADLVSAGGHVKVENVGLAYNKLAPTAAGGSEKSAFIRALAEHAKVADDYDPAFMTWVAQTPGEAAVSHRRVLWFRSTARLLVGLGEAGPTENGLTLHPVYGTPFLPGATLKGITRAWCNTALADDPAWGPESDAFGQVFGSAAESTGAQGRAGLVHFLDAWWIPKGCGKTPAWAAEIQTPHYAKYVQGTRPPDGMESPNPITFLAAQGCFRVVLEGPKAWLVSAERMLTLALREHGIGAKTRAGYGRLIRIDEDGANEKRLVQEAQQQRDAPRKKLIRERQATRMSPDDYQVVWQADATDEQVYRALSDLLSGAIPKGWPKAELGLEVHSRAFCQALRGSSRGTLWARGKTGIPTMHIGGKKVKEKVKLLERQACPASNGEDTGTTDGGLSFEGLADAMNEGPQALKAFLNRYDGADTATKKAVLSAARKLYPKSNKAKKPLKACVDHKQKKVWKV